MDNWKTPKLESLADAILSLKNREDLLEFLRDLCTAEELNELSNRWHAAILLNTGLPYRKIAEETGLSTATVTRIAHWLKDGAGGYKKALIPAKKTTFNG